MKPDPIAARAALQNRLAPLREREARLSARLNDRSEPLPADSGEQALALEDEEVLRDLNANERAEIQRITAALARLDAGTWGICVSCGGRIEPKRLAALPTADRCLACAKE